MNLAIKHSPQNYNEVAGNAKSILELKNRTLNNNFPKVVLFTGKPGTGKTSMGNIYIKNLLCENLKEDIPCNNCIYCDAVDRGEDTEGLYFYDGGSFGVSEADDVISKARKNILGRKDKKKVIVIDELQSIKSKSAEEKLSKVLEKKKDNCYYVLGAMRWKKLGVAIKRRAVKFHMTLTPSEIGGYLVKICDAEGVEKNEDLLNILKAIINSCDGSLGEAVSILERVIYSQIKTEKELIEELNIISDSTLDDMINSLLTGDAQIFETKINEDILKQMNYKLNLIYKHFAGYELKGWEAESIKNIENIDCTKVNSTIQELNELKKYSYCDDILIEYTIVNILLKNKPKRKPRGEK